MNIVNRNNSYEVANRSDVAVFVKKFDIQERYDCELKYASYFRSQGFRVPAVLESDPGNLTITFEFVDGHVVKGMDASQRSACIKVLARIFNLNNCQDKKKPRDDYIRSFIECVGSLASEQARPVDQDAFSFCVEQLRAYFHSSLFKDAKISNWIFTRDEVVMVDFDYVKESFFLADLAQLQNYQSPKQDWRLALNEYLGLISLPRQIPEGIARNLYLMAAVNSALAAQRRNPLMVKSLKRKLKGQASANLGSLGILRIR